MTHDRAKEARRLAIAAYTMESRKPAPKRNDDVMKASASTTKYWDEQCLILALEAGLGGEVEA